VKWRRWWRELRSLGLGVRMFDRLVLLFVTTLVAAFLMSTCSIQTNAYSIQGQSDLVTVEPSCGRYVTWDLGAGLLSVTRLDAMPVMATGKDAAKSAMPAASAASGVTLGFGPGARMVLERLPDDSVRAVLSASRAFERCASRPEVGEYSLRGTDGDPDLVVHREFSQQQLRERVIEFRSMPADAQSSAVSAQRSFTHVLEGRVVLGAAVQHGAGWGPSSAPILRSAELNVRTRERFTDQSITVHSEKLDAGSIVDTLPCMEAGWSWLDRLRYHWDSLKGGVGATDGSVESICQRAMRGPAFGFVRANKDGGLDVVVHALTDRVGITPHQGELRQVYITYWTYLKNSPFLLTVFAVLFFASSFAQALSSLSIWKGDPRSEDLKGFGASPPTPLAPPLPPADNPRGSSSDHPT